MPNPYKVSRSTHYPAMLGLIIALMVVALATASAQTFTVIHNFTGPDGYSPQGALAMDGAGNIYGSTRISGVYKLSYRGTWILNPLYNFRGGNDGYDPHGGVVLGPNGTLYGTTWNGGGQGCNGGCGTIFNLRPPATFPSSVLAPWMETILHSFQGPPDGQNPEFGTLVFDSSGVAYGTTELGGNQTCSRGSCGTVYKLTRSGGQWTETVIYAFTSDLDGTHPFGGVIFDNAGNLFGTTYEGGQYGYGTVFELTPSGGDWTKTILHQFTGGDDGSQPATALLRDSAGNLYGTTTEGGQNGAGGTVFELSPSGGGGSFTVLYSFVGGQGPFEPLTIDGAGNLYGTTVNGGLFGAGTVFELSSSANGWVYTPLHNFTNGTDGGQPISTVLMGSDGALYGTAIEGGDLRYCGRGGCGVVWQITP